MNTNEHTEVGDALDLSSLAGFIDGNKLSKNPYFHRDAKTGVWSIDIQGIDDASKLPYSTKLKLTAGNIVGMAGDYFGGKEVSYKLPSLAEFKKNPANFDNAISLGHYLINQGIDFEDKGKFVAAYLRLANPNVTQDEIDTIYKINNANYVPFSETLTEYVQQIMFALRVKNYSEILTRNLSHFSPWSVRAYIIGHNLALMYAELAHEFNQFADNPGYVSTHGEFNKLRKTLEQMKDGTAPDKLRDYAHRFQALAVCVELFANHYYSDHFCAGHIQPMGDLRARLPEKHGTLGNILVNNLHDESNATTIFTRKPYDPTPDDTAPPIEAGGDGNIDSSKNYYNKQACIAGMQTSLADLKHVFNGGKSPKQSNYGGLEYLPDIDPNYRQPQPLLILGSDDKIYYRKNLSKIRILSPSQWKAAYESPKDNGYTELRGTWDALVLVFKLRVLSFIYGGKLQKPSEEELRLIEQEEHALNPKRQPIPRPPKSTQATPEAAPNTAPAKPKVAPKTAAPARQKDATPAEMMKGLHAHSILRQKVKATNPQAEESYTHSRSASAA